MERGRQIVLQSFPRHLDQTVCRRAGRRFQVGAGMPVNVDDFTPGVHEDRRWRVARDQQLLDEIGNRGGAHGGKGRLGLRAGLGGPFHQSLRKPFQTRKRAGLRRPPEQFPFPVDDSKERFELPDRFGRTEEQDAVRLQGIVEQRQEFLLCLGFQIDQEIAAGQEVQLRKGGIGQDVMSRKHDQIPNLLLNPVTAVFPGKEPLQARRGEVLGDADRVEAGACLVNGPAVQVRGENLERETELLLRQILPKQDGERIGLLSGGTAGNPQAQGRALRLALHESGQHFLFEDLEGLGIAKEAGDTDEQLLEQSIELMRIRQHKPKILFQIFDLVHVHPAFEAPVNRVLFVEGKVVPGPVAQEDEDLAQRLRGVLFRKRQRRFGQAAGICAQRLRHLVRRLDHIDHPGRNGAARHALILGRLRILGDRHAGLGLDRSQPHGAVAAGPGQDDPHGSVLLVFRQRTEEVIDGQRHAILRGRLHEVQDAMQDRQIGAARRHIDAIRLYLHPVRGLHHRHRGAFTKQARQETDMARVLVRHHHEGHPAAGRRVAEELFHGFQPAGGGADPDDQETRRCDG